MDMKTLLKLVDEIRNCADEFALDLTNWAEMELEDETFEENITEYRRFITAAFDGAKADMLGKLDAALHPDEDE